MRGIKKGENKLKRLALFMLFLIIFLVLLNSVRKVYNKKQAADRALARMEEEAKTLEDRKQFLTTSLERLKTKEGLDFEIRKKLNVAATGESVAIIVEDEATTSPDSSSPTPWQKLKNFWNGLWD